MFYFVILIFISNYFEVLISWSITTQFYSQPSAFLCHCLMCFFFVECLPFVLGLASTSCGLTTPLDRIQSPFHLTTRFGMVHSSTVSLVADLTSAVLTSIPFSVIAPNDVGGTLKWQLRLLFFSHVRLTFS